MNIKEVWEVFKNSSMLDKDMQRAFRNSVTPNACIELLEENEDKDKRIAELEKDLSECLQMLDNFHKNIGSLGAKNLADKIRDQAKSLKEQGE